MTGQRATPGAAAAKRRPADIGRARARRVGLRAGERRRSDSAPRLQPGRHGARARLGPARIIPEHAQLALLTLLLEAYETDAADFPYDPAFGEPYNSRERFFVERIGDTAGWLHAGRPRREAARIALRLHLRTQIGQLVLEATRFVEETAQPVALSTCRR